MKIFLFSVCNAQGLKKPQVKYWYNYNEKPKRIDSSWSNILLQGFNCDNDKEDKCFDPKISVKEIQVLIFL